MQVYVEDLWCPLSKFLSISTNQVAAWAADIACGGFLTRNLFIAFIFATSFSCQSISHKVNIYRSRGEPFLCEKIEVLGWLAVLKFLDRAVTIATFEGYFLCFHAQFLFN